MTPKLQQSRDKTQMANATKDLWKYLQSHPEMKADFTPEQIKAIESGARKIPGFTWHHNEDGTTLQLVDENDHKTPHAGGRKVYGGCR